MDVPLRIANPRPADRLLPAVPVDRALLAARPGADGLAVAFVPGPAKDCDFLLEHIEDQAAHDCVQLPPEGVADQRPGTAGFVRLNAASTGLSLRLCHWGSSSNSKKNFRTGFFPAGTPLFSSDFNDQADILPAPLAQGRLHPYYRQNVTKPG
jgi:hypothetical protein